MIRWISSPMSPLSSASASSAGGGGSGGGGRSAAARRAAGCRAAACRRLWRRRPPASVLVAAAVLDQNVHGFGDRRQDRRFDARPSASAGSGGGSRWRRRRVVGPLRRPRRRLHLRRGGDARGNRRPEIGGGGSAGFGGARAAEAPPACGRTADLGALGRTRWRRRRLGAPAGLSGWRSGRAACAPAGLLLGRRAARRARRLARGGARLRPGVAGFAARLPAGAGDPGGEQGLAIGVERDAGAADQVARLLAEDLGQAFGACRWSRRRGPSAPAP